MYKRDVFCTVTFSSPIFRKIFLLHTTKCGSARQFSQTFQNKLSTHKNACFRRHFEGVPKCNICSRFVNNIFGAEHLFFIHFYNISNRKDFECSFQQFEKPPQNRHFYKISTEFSTIATAFLLVFNQVFNTFALESGF